VSSFYAASATEFIQDDPQRILGLLTAKAAAAHFTQQRREQTSAWLRQVQILQATLTEILQQSRGWEGNILLEYPIPRRGKRIDAVILATGCILVLEFKCGFKLFERGAIIQLEDYCLDLRDFHRESRSMPITPILIATDAPDTPAPQGFTSDQVQSVWTANERNLAAKILAAISKHSNNCPPIELARWDNSQYEPTPTIIEAAQALYAGNNVQKISRCEAGIENLTKTSQAVVDLIAVARSQSRKLICFVTGVPGAGKTLAGLNIVHNNSLHEGELGVFLSGNGPLVRVLTEALARDHQARTQSAAKASRREVSAFIQNVHRFVETTSNTARRSLLTV